MIPIPKTIRERLLELQPGDSRDFKLDECSAQSVRNAANHIAKTMGRSFVTSVMGNTKRTQIIRVWRAA